MSLQPVDEPTATLARSLGNPFEERQEIRPRSDAMVRRFNDAPSADETFASTKATCSAIRLKVRPELFVMTGPPSMIKSYYK